ncbi:MAG: Kelch repeat-containing protein [Promethearchaeota archaeon]
MNNQIVSPSPRSGHGMVYDPVNQKVILFGGGNENHIFMNDTWVYDYLTNTWTGMITSPDSTYIPSTSLLRQRLPTYHFHQVLQSLL